MVRHIVMWRLKDEALGNTKESNAQKMKADLEALNGRIPGMLSLEVGFNYNGGDFDLALTSVHESREALAVYNDHPEHVVIKKFVGQVVSQRAACDYDMK